MTLEEQRSIEILKAAKVLDKLDPNRFDIKTRGCGYFFCGVWDHSKDGVAYLEKYTSSSRIQIMAHNGGGVVPAIVGEEVREYLLEQVLFTILGKGIDLIFLEVHFSCGHAHDLMEMSYLDSLDANMLSRKWLNVQLHSLSRNPKLLEEVLLRMAKKDKPTDKIKRWVDLAPSLERVDIIPTGKTFRMVDGNEKRKTYFQNSKLLLNKEKRSALESDLQHVSRPSRISEIAPHMHRYSMAV